jgi:rare lipoprotein A
VAGALCKRRNVVQTKTRNIVLIILPLLGTHLTPTRSGHATEKSQSGVASVYSLSSGGGTASGQKLNPGALTAAHRTLPFGTRVRVTNKENGRFVVVTVNDRGPFVKGRIIDLTPAAASALGFAGLTRVAVEVVN